MSHWRLTEAPFRYDIVSDLRLLRQTTNDARTANARPAMIASVMFDIDDPGGSDHELGRRGRWLD